MTTENEAHTRHWGVIVTTGEYKRALFAKLLQERCAIYKGERI